MIGEQDSAGYPSDLSKFMTIWAAADNSDRLGPDVNLSDGGPGDP